MPYDDDWYAGTPSKGPVKGFDILTEQDAIVLRGSRDEANDQVLTGRVVLNLKSAISGKVRLRFSRRIRHTERIQRAGDGAGNPGSIDIVNDMTDISDEYLVPDHTKFIPGEYTWNFSIPIKADFASSLEGPYTTYVVYRLKCVVERGVLSRDLVQRKHIRIHRTFNPDSLALQQAMTTENCWTDKCAYKISTPTKGVIYGTHVPMEFKLAPLAKGIRPCRIKCSVMQVVKLHKSIYTSFPYPVQEKERVVSEKDRDLPEGEIEQDVESWYTINHIVPLPRELTKACQTYKESRVPDIEIKHYLNYKLGIMNPDGHISEIQGRLPIHLFFTQSMHVEGNSVSGFPDLSGADPMQSALNDIPPDYNHIHLDALYDSINMSGYATPAHTNGAWTPRNPSASNMDGIDEAEDEDADNEAHANALRNRLDNDINPVSTSTPPPNNEPNANALRNRLEQINLAASPTERGTSPSNRSGEHSPIGIPRNRSFHGPLSHSPLACTFFTPSQEHDDPLLHDLQRPQPVRSHTSPGHGASASTIPTINAPGIGSTGSSPSHSGAATPGGVRSALPTRPSSPIHFEDLNRVPSYNTAVRAPAATGAYGSQHGGEGLPTYKDVEQESASASRSGSVTGGSAGMGAAAGGSGPGTETPRTLAETGRSRSSGLFSSLLHKHK